MKIVKLTLTTKQADLQKRGGEVEKSASYQDSVILMKGMA